MATTRMNGFLRRLTRGMAAAMLAELSDRQLVERLLAAPDDAAFEALVRRHGPMVYRVCRRVLQQAEDCEDAFQATFLLLAQKLRTVRKRDSLASWLHGVAHRVALDARKQAARRRRHEGQAAIPRPGPPDDITWKELRTVLDAELARLPEKLRAPLILCYLEGRTQDEAARQLGWSKSTLLRRLEEARTVLGRRLTGRGVVWPAALSAVLLSDCVAPAALPPRLLGSTVEAAACIATGNAAPAAAVSAHVAALTEGVLKTMFASKLKIATAALVLLAAVAGGAGGLLYQTQAAEPQQTLKAQMPPARERDKPQAAPKEKVVTERFILQHASADQVDQTLTDVLKLLKEKDIRTVHDPRTNSLVVVGSKAQLRLVEALIRRLDELLGRIDNTESKVGQLKDRVAHGQRLVMRGLASMNQVELEKTHLKAAETTLEKLTKELKDFQADPKRSLAK